jgi:hypothetical protein
MTRDDARGQSNNAVATSRARRSSSDHKFIMDHSYEPTSPVSSQSSGSPPPEEIEEIAALADARRIPSSSGSNKRRGPPSGTHGPQFARDAKSRRREDSHGTGQQGSTWSNESKKDREELVDVKLAEYLRKGVQNNS